MDDCDVGGLLPALEDIQQAANRSAGLTRQLLTLARRDIARPVLLDLNAVIQDMASGLQRMLGPDIEFVVLLEEGFGMGIRMDTSQVEQIILNLVVNAGDAMRKGGKLKIESFECLDVPAAPGAAAPVRRVGLRVSDTGVGMDKDTLDRLFEPFFTTKEDGTGLGLATVYGITQQAGGSIDVTSTLGSGSVFEICLPWSGSVPEAERERRSSRREAPTIPMRGTPRRGAGCRSQHPLKRMVK